MAKKKDFARKNTPATAEPTPAAEALEPQAVQIPPPCTSVSLDKNQSGLRQYDFQNHYGQGADEIVYYCQRLIELLIRESRATTGQSIAMTTIVSYCQNGLAWFLPFCSVWSSVLDRELTLADIDQTLIQRFVQYLVGTEKPVSS